MTATTIDASGPLGPWSPGDESNALREPVSAESRSPPSPISESSLSLCCQRYHVPCSAAILQSLPSSPVLDGPTSAQDSGGRHDSQRRCHFRSQEILHAAHLEPEQARWECRLEEGAGLRLIEATGSSVEPHVTEVDTEVCQASDKGHSEGELERRKLRCRHELRSSSFLMFQHKS